MKRDNLFFGSFLGMIAPVIAYLLTLFNMDSIINNKPLALYAIAVLLNLLLMRYFYHFKLSRSAQGVIFVTFIIALGVLFIADFKIPT